MRHILPETMCEGVWFHQEVRVHIERSHPACVVGDLVSERLHGEAPAWSALNRLP